MHQHNSFKLRHQALHMAVMSALPAILALNSNIAMAACNGTIASPSSATISVLCNNNGASTNGNLTVSDSTTYVDTTGVGGAAVTGGTNLLQFDGHGRILTVSAGAQLSNLRNVAGARTAVVMGASTQNASATTTFAASPTTGASVVTLVNQTPAATWVGQSITFGRWDAADGDFIGGKSYIITAVDTATKTVTIQGTLESDFAGSGSNSLPLVYSVVSNYGKGTTVNGEFYNNVIRNSGTISARIQASEISTTAAPYTSALKAITTSVIGDYLIVNNESGVISTTHGGIGNALTIEQGGQVEGLTINNNGLIQAERTSTLTTASVTATANPTATGVLSTGTTLAASTIGNVNAINTQEEAEEIEINNGKTGVIRSKGDYSGTIYMRAAEKTIVNEGLIEHVATNGTISKGFAIAAVSNPGEVRTMSLTNTESGVIHGDILAVNGNGLRYYLLSTSGHAADLNNRLNINSQYGQSDSEIINAGTILGNFYYSNGTHSLSNEESGTITGNIDVDQRNTVGLVSAVATNGALAGTKSFSFANEGTYTGNLTVRTDTGSQVTLIPTILGSGSGSTQASPSSEIAGMGGTLTVWNGTTSTIDTTTTLAPTIANGVAVKNGAWFKVADTLFGTTLPSVESTALVDWQVAKNTSGNLVVGAQVTDATTVSGLSGTQGNIINALMSSNDALGGTVQSYTSANDIASLANQLSPEINGAGFRAVTQMSDQVIGLVENRLAEVHLASISGKTGISTGESAINSGIWVQGFGFTGEQDTHKKINGYDVDGYGFAFGADTLLGSKDHIRIGGALSYGQSNVDNTGTNKNKTDIDSYIATVYASWLADHYYINTNLSLGKHEFNSARIVLGNQISGNHDAWQYIAKVDAGLPMKIGSASFIPVASLAYSYLDEDSYTEKGVGALKVSTNHTDSFRSGLGARAILPLADGSAKAALELRTIWNHEFADTAQDSTARFAAGGSSFNVKGANPERDSADLGATLHLSNSNTHLKQSLLVSYDADVKSHYVSHTGKIQARFEF